MMNMCIIAHDNTLTLMHTAPGVEIAVALSALSKHAAHIISFTPCAISKVVLHLVAEGDASSYEAMMQGILLVKTAHPHTVILENEGPLGYFFVFMYRAPLAEIAAAVLSRRETTSNVYSGIQPIFPTVVTKRATSRKRRPKRRNQPTPTAIAVRPSATPTLQSPHEGSTFSTNIDSLRELACDILGKQSTQVIATLTWITKMVQDPTALESVLHQTFIEQKVPKKELVMFCQSNSWYDCVVSGDSAKCAHKIHFEKVAENITDLSLGDCAYLDSCFKGKQCKYTHYRMRYPGIDSTSLNATSATAVVPYIQPAQYMKVDLLQLDFNLLGNDFSAMIVDPPWSIHTNPNFNGGFRDDDVFNLDIAHLQSTGVIFLWVTGRVLEFGRKCLLNWGYTHIEELIWLKTNQLGKTICTGRTGHWLNHTKEHVLVGIKSVNATLGLQLDADILVSNALGNSQKPDEVYHIIDRLVGSNTKKIELFGRRSNMRPGWITLGNE